MQRLFSTFAGGLPGAGLLLQRIVTGCLLIQNSVQHWVSSSLPVAALGTGTGFLLIIGLWTPIVGGAVAIMELSAVFFQSGDPVNAILLATLGATLALIGPGAWSIDARIFGRKQISVPER